MNRASKIKWAAVACVAAIALILVVVRPELLKWRAAGYLLLLVCPLMHLFMHGGHEKSGHGKNDIENGTKEK